MDDKSQVYRLPGWGEGQLKMIEKKIARVFGAIAESKIVAVISDKQCKDEVARRDKMVEVRKFVKEHKILPSDLDKRVLAAYSDALTI